MSLSVALEQAKTALSLQAARANVTSNNITNVNTAGFHRRTQQVTSYGDYGLSFTTSRETNAALETALLNATGESAQQNIQTDILAKLKVMLADPGDPASIPSTLASLGSSVTQFLGNPADQALGRATISSASNAVDAIKSAATQIQDARLFIDQQLGQAATDITKNLKDIQDIEQKLGLATNRNEDINTLLDKRDEILSKLSGIISIRVIPRPDNQISIYTDSGIVLYDKSPREVASVSRMDTQLGVYVTDLTIDGLNATAPNSLMPISSGGIFGLVNARENILKPAAVQLDETARVLVDAFADEDSQDPATLPKVQGLIQIDGSTGEVPSSYSPGIATRLSISSFARDPATGVKLLRDGGLGNPTIAAYNHNTTGAEAFQGRLEQVNSKFNAVASFDPSGQVKSGVTLSAYSANSSAWINDISKVNKEQAETKNATQSYLQQQLALKTGVNLDDETARMLDIQHSYQVSAKLISSIDDMFNSLLASIN